MFDELFKSVASGQKLGILQTRMDQTRDMNFEYF